MIQHMSPRCAAWGKLAQSSQTRFIVLGTCAFIGSVNLHAREHADTFASAMIAAQAHARTWAVCSRPVVSRRKPISEQHGVCRATVIDVGLETLSNLVSQLNSAQEQVIAAFFKDDTSTVARDIQWVTVAGVGILGLIAADVALRTIDNVLSLGEGKELERLSDSELDARGSLDEEPEVGMLPERKREMETVLLQDQTSERRRSLLFLVGANVLFWFGTQAFERNPETPLQP